LVEKVGLVKLALIPAVLELPKLIHFPLIIANSGSFPSFIEEGFSGERGGLRVRSTESG
jgi:hypothetical protein